MKLTFLLFIKELCSNLNNALAEILQSLELDLERLQLVGVAESLVRLGLDSVLR